MPVVLAMTGYSRPAIYKLLKSDASFPRPVPLSNGKSRNSPVGFVLSEVQQWVKSRIAMREVAA
ncbi:helix-turn-helix transcriptional regulator [Pseudomonas sp. LRF_L74]|uniref:helix-turn-helix transcriptional regulator n=1 Tax=Pseudomonas sp. LRF_L74 TaxID=3369422 RepID=UPI003F5E24F9